MERRDVQRSILATLVPQPLPKWGLREALHLPDAVIARELAFLRDQGRLKLIGYRRVNTWALASWQPTPGPAKPQGQRPDHGDEATAIRTPKPAPPNESWWTRPEFRNA